ncbi:hypothetical protein LAZ67_8000496 [Cordylochernes scorpioides]|uniref:Heme-binding protein 2 n=1 Tax=Cordylochernes scorpioides TaxID=51811 RepID=A0ABY6KRE9_9ARAC|nr:hypothetical protein LAZ67_8000496 [Cordylochernes scorpioides]
MIIMDYEERQYPAATWISTSAEGPSLTEASQEMYRRLFSYTQGNNLNGIVLNATTPVRMRIIPCRGATCPSMFIMSFLIPAELGEGAPYPTDGALYIEREPALRYVIKMWDSRSFGGRPTETDWLEQAHQLAELVRKDMYVEKSFYYTVWYDPPFQLFNRLNEIWMVKNIESGKPANTTEGTKRA